MSYYDDYSRSLRSREISHQERIYLPMDKNVEKGYAVVMEGDPRRARILV